MRKPEINKNYEDVFKLKKTTQIYPIFDLIDGFLHCWFRKMQLYKFTNWLVTHALRLAITSDHLFTPFRL